MTTKIESDSFHDEVFWQKILSHKERLAAYAIKLVGEHQVDIEDLVHDTMIKAYVQRNQFYEGSNFFGWVSKKMRSHHFNPKKRVPVQMTYTLQILFIGYVCDTPLEFCDENPPDSD